MFRCSECGCLFDEPDEWKEDMGEHFGRPCYQTMNGCPRCGGNYHEYHDIERDDVVTDDMRLAQMLKNWKARRDE